MQKEGREGHFALVRSEGEDRTEQLERKKCLPMEGREKKKKEHPLSGSEGQRPQARKRTTKSSTAHIKPHMLKMGRTPSGGKDQRRVKNQVYKKGGAKKLRVKTGMIGPWTKQRGAICLQQKAREKNWIYRINEDTKQKGGIGKKNGGALQLQGYE